VPRGEQKKDAQRRLHFREHADWDAMAQLLEGAGLFRPQRLVSASEAQHDDQRVLAMLVLTSFFGIMKVRSLRLTVEEAHGSWAGFQPGEVIDDHVSALGYLLEHYPDVLPSFAGLPTQAQRTVRFTQCRMDYNMGWLVQAEAPPGPLLRSLRTAVLTGNASQQDIAFYFVHWFTALAGSVPTPMTGSEKFVLGFPLKVLSSFVASFSAVWNLGISQSETQVYEKYLRWRWETHKPNLGPVPEGYGCVAQLRLVVMAQGNSKLLLKAFRKLPERDRRVLSEELARTGCAGQHYQHDAFRDQRGPALLLYYGPAFLQKAGLLDPFGALGILAEVLRQARSLWPLQASAGAETVTIRIDTLKAETVTTCRNPPDGQVFVLDKSSSRSASVSRIKFRDFKASFDAGDMRRCMLNF